MFLRKSFLVAAVPVLTLIPMVAFAVPVMPSDGCCLGNGWPTWIARKHTIGQYDVAINFIWGSNLQTTGSAWRNAFQAGINAWSGAGTKAYYTSGTSNASVLNTYWADDNYTGKTIAYIDAQGYLTRCDVYGNNQYVSGWVTLDFQNTAAHELGHCIGLSHTTNTTSLMQEFHTLIGQPNQFDIDAVNAMYR